MNKERMIKIILLTITVLSIAFKLFSYITELTPINSAIDKICSITLLISIIVCIILVTRYSRSKFKILETIILSVVAGIMLLITSLQFLLGFLIYYEEIGRFSSSSGKNEVIILEGGFIDAVYYAYPTKYKWFYQYQENGFVSKHDDWGGAKIEVDWVQDDKVIVKIISAFDIPNEGTNPNDEIVVSFK